MEMPTAERVIELLTPLAQGLKVTVEHLYVVLVKQSYVQGAQAIASAAFCIAVAIFLYKKIDGLRKYSLTEKAVGPEWLAVVIGYVVCFAMSMSAWENIHNSLSYLINPEYAAIKNVTELVTGSGESNRKEK